ncbi:MAG: ChbG/HpnK family deacetylase [Candidatus Aegiribacteria sp.]
MAEMKLMVTLDDLGISPGVNSSAAELIPLGVVDCLSIMPTGPEFAGAVELASSSDAAVSVHLNCIEPPFLTGTGFPSSQGVWFFRGKSFVDEVREEWRRQIERVLAGGLMVTRLDSHQHIHHVPGLRELILELAGEYGISSIRSAVLPDRWRSLEALTLDRLGRKLARMASSAGISTPDAMMGFTAAGSVSAEYLRYMENSTRGGGTAELVMHPSIEPEWSLYQPEEHRLMGSEWFREWKEAH